MAGRHYRVVEVFVGGWARWWRVCQGLKDCEGLMEVFGAMCYLPRVADLFSRKMAASSKVSIFMFMAESMASRPRPNPLTRRKYLQEDWPPSQTGKRLVF